MIARLGNVTLLLLAIFSSSVSSTWAISEVEYAKGYLYTVLPFMQTGETFLFKIRDGTRLSAVHFSHPNPKGTILILPGQSEPWLKYAEIFYDLYEKGYSLYSYDHRGQGLSEHLVRENRQIGHIERFESYVEDLEDFVATVLVSPRVPPNEEKFYLLAHSMGAGIAAKYLSRGVTPFRAAVLSSPMLMLNTKPYSIPVARTITAAAVVAGQGEKYARGKGDFDPSAPFESNDVTGSPERFWMTNAVARMHPLSVIGGPSNEWVHQALVATPKIVKGMKGILTPTLLFQSGRDQLVKPKGQNEGCAKTAACSLVLFPEAEHEILMEKDFIRDSAMAKIEAFFKAE